MEHLDKNAAGASPARAAAEPAVAPGAVMRSVDGRPHAGGQRTWVAAIQASPHALAQRQLIQGVFGDPARRGGPALTHPRAAAQVARAPVQAKPIPDLDVGARQAGPNRIWIGGERTPVNTFWQVAVGSKPTRAQLIQATAQAAAALGGQIDRIVRDEWNMKPAEFGNTGNRYFDPLMVRFAGDYGGNPMQFDYHFGSSFSGYVIRVDDPAGGIVNQTMNEKSEDLDVATEYSHVHEVERHPVGSILDTGSADAVTKLAGEGARWQCIGNNVASIRDDTRIYTNENAAGEVSPNVRSVDFPTLWKSWAATFGKSYGIPDTDVSQQLRLTNVKVTTMKGVEDRAVESGPSTAMRHGIDVCVDADKPATQADLNLGSVQYLEFTIRRGKVFDLSAPLQDHVDAMILRVKGIPDLTYMGIGACTGAKTFEFLCKRTGPQPPALEGYDVAAVGGVVRYPLYREHRVAGKVSNVYAPPARDGAEAYLHLMQVTYDYHLGKLDDYMGENFITTGIEGLRELIKSKLLIWDGTSGSEVPDSDDYTGGDKDEDIQSVLDEARLKPASKDEPEVSDEDEEPEPEKKKKGNKGAKKGGKSKK